MKSELRRICFFFLIVLLSSCAIQVPPGGGEQDVAGPKVIYSKPENFSKGFTGHSVEIRFNEYIQLKDAQSQLVISPPLKNFPELKIRKKSLHIYFEDTLSEQTTYSFNFGNSIVDNNEGNSLTNYQFVFSTGDIIDSLEVSGIMKNAANEKTEKDLLVMLYKESDDSLPFLMRPYYFAKTDDSGRFQIRYISSDSYKIIGLKDDNRDYLYNPVEESIAFSESPVISGSSGIRLRTFKEEEKIKLLKAYSDEPGKAVCVFNGVADTLAMHWISDTNKIDIYATIFSSKKDSLYIWYKNQDADTIQLSFPTLNPDDTTTIRLLKKGSFNKGKFKQSLQVFPQVSGGNYQDLNHSFEITFNHPLEKANLALIEVLEDSVKVTDASFYFTDSLRTCLRYSNVWKPGSQYIFLIPEAAFTDIFSLQNDTVISTFRTRQETDYASLTGNLKSAEGNYPAIVQLVDENDRVYQEISIMNDTIVEFGFITAGKYRLKIIQDQNSNGRWDTGNYLKKIQPENVIYYPEIIQMRSNWDVEIKWQMP
ncbi:MAG TPA: Ig-like domain-containing protein [Bacteroidia bacterium]|nr:Ig-like domain-containing protein [Bacteroidia bacterium]